MIRSLKMNDLESALELIWKVFLEFEAPDYSEQGTESFRKFIQLNQIQGLVKKGELRFWGSFEAEGLTGVIGVKHGNHISMLFVDPAFHRRGIATALVSEAFREYHGTVTVNSSPFALAFYRCLGFQDQSGEQIIDGIRFTLMKMEK